MRRGRELQGKDITLTSVVRRKSLYFDCHSGLDPESSLVELDSRFRGNDGSGMSVKKRWTHYTSDRWYHRNEKLGNLTKGPDFGNQFNGGHPKTRG